MATTGKKLNSAREVDSGAWADRYSLTAAQAAVFISFHETCVIDNDGNKCYVANAVYDSATAFSGVEATYYKLPKGSCVVDLQDSKVYWKLNNVEDGNAWKYASLT